MRTVLFADGLPDRIEQRISTIKPAGFEKVLGFLDRIEQRFEDARVFLLLRQDRLNQSGDGADEQVLSLQFKDIERRRCHKLLAIQGENDDSRLPVQFDPVGGMRQGQGMANVVGERLDRL